MSKEITVRPTVRPMVFKEARECADRINAGINNVRQDVVALHDRDGYTALGYKTWEECVEQEFKQAERYIFYQLKAAQIEQNVSDCTIVQLGTIPEGQLRPLAKLESDQQRIAWQKVIDIAPEGKITAALVTKVVREMTKKTPKIKIKIDLREEVDPEFEAAWKMMYEAIKGLNLTKWKTMKRETAIDRLENFIAIIQNKKWEE